MPEAFSVDSGRGHSHVIDYSFSPLDARRPYRSGGPPACRRAGHPARRRPGPNGLNASELQICVEFTGRRDAALYGRRDAGRYNGKDGAVRQDLLTARHFPSAFSPDVLNGCDSFK